MIERDAFTLGLLLPGGGARGAYQAGALNAIAEIVSGDHNPFPVIAGVSVGAINAVALAARADAFKQGVKEISDFWHRLHSSDVFRTDFLSISLRGLHWVVSLTPIASLGIPNPHSLLDNTPLRRLISDNIDFPRIEPAIGSGMLKSISVTASSYDRGRAVTFFQPVSDAGAQPAFQNLYEQQRTSSHERLGSAAPDHRQAPRSSAQASRGQCFRPRARAGTGRSRHSDAHKESAPRCFASVGIEATRARRLISVDRDSGFGRR